MVELGHHAALDHPLEGVLAEVAEALGVADRTGRIDGRDRPGREHGIQAGREDAADDRVVGHLPGLARARVPPRAGREELADVDDESRCALVEPDAAQGVVELVAEEHRGDAERLDLVEATVDVGLGALWDAEHLLAAERLGHLDAQNDGELAGLDDVGRLLRAGHDPEPALASAAVLRVDVGLECVGVRGLAPDRVHVVARVLARGGNDRLDGAHAGVGDQVVDHDPLAAAPGPLDPLVVHLLVQLGIALRPARKAGPAHGVVGLRRVLIEDDVLGAQRTVGPVLAIANGP